MKQINYNEYFEQKVQALTDYVKKYNLEALILGISGGIDSTVCAAICHEVTKRVPVKFIGRSLPTKNNKEGEITTADLVGKAFCNDFEVYSLSDLWEDVENSFMRYESKTPTPISSGNIQARLRMIYLYNIASLHGGLVMDTDNLTENNLGYFTIHGDVGDFNPIGGLWKTQVFELAEWIMNWYGSYTHTYFYTDAPEIIKYKQGNLAKAKAIKESLKLQPTAGLGITDNDLEELGAESYEQVDKVLQCLTDSSISTDTIDDIPDTVLESIVRRYNASKFKRKRLPIKIDRIWLQ